jgi:stage V sporulation protein G
MNITEVRISLRDDAKLKAFASITLDNCFVVRGLKIIEGKSGTFVAMPSRKRKDGEYQDIAHPINNEARAVMERVILKAFREEMERSAVTEPLDVD